MKTTAKKTLVMVMLSGVLGGAFQPGLGAADQPDEQVRRNIDTLIKTNSCSGCDLRGADLNRLDLAGADLRDADLSGASLYLVNLSDGDLRGANVQGAHFGGADLANADLRGADLQGAVFAGAYTVGTRMDGEAEQAASEPEQQSQSEPEVGKQGVRAAEPVPEKDAEKIDQQRDRIKQDRPGARPLKAPPEKRIAPPSPVTIDAETSSVEDTPLVIPEQASAAADPIEQPPSAADRHAPAAPATAEDELPDDSSSAEGPVAPETAPATTEDEERFQAALTRLLDDGSCYRCELAGADLSGKNLSEADLESADLTGADLRGTNLRGANLKNVSFRNATLTEARLDKADLYKADFSGADLSGTSFSGAQTDEADFSDAIGYQPPAKKQ